MNLPPKLGKMEELINMLNMGASSGGEGGWHHNIRHRSSGELAQSVAGIGSSKTELFKGISDVLDTLPIHHLNSWGEIASARWVGEHKNLRTLRANQRAAEQKELAAWIGTEVSRPTGRLQRPLFFKSGGH